MYLRVENLTVPKLSSPKWTIVFDSQEEATNALEMLRDQLKEFNYAKDIRTTTPPIKH